MRCSCKVTPNAITTMARMSEGHRHERHRCEPVELRYQGLRRTADVRIVTDEDGVAEYYTVIVRHNPGFARINKIGVNRDGTADPDGLRAAWAAGARVMLLTLL